MTDRPVGLLLAAGAASRFGGDKLLQPGPGARPLVLAALRPLRQAVGEVVAVVASGRGRLASLLDENGCRVAVNPEPNRGLGSSIACGVAASPAAAGWLVALADMPAVRSSSVRAVAAALADGAPLAAPDYRGRRGHPVAFHADYRDALLGLEGDHGGRQLLHRHAPDLIRVPVNDPGVLLDIDTPGDLARFLREADADV